MSIYCISFISQDMDGRIFWMGTPGKCACAPLDYQPAVPGLPLKGPTISAVTQPP